MTAKPEIYRFNKYVLRTETCWLWTAGKDKDGYGRFRSQMGQHAHRWAYAHYRGSIPSDAEVCHECDNPACVNPAHLFLGSSGDNSSDMCAKGRQAKGELIGNSKLTGLGVKCIRESHHLGVPVNEIAQKYGVALSTVYRILNGITWKHLIEEASNS